MAGDYLAIRLNLIDDPHVVAIAELCGIDRFGVVGRLVTTWAWAGEHADEDGRITCGPRHANRHADSVTPVTQLVTQVCATRAHLNLLTACEQWSEALIAVGWLIVDDTGLTFPEWDKWNGKSARKRLLDARRAASYRARQSAERHANPSRGERDESVTTVQYSSKSPLPPLAEQGGKRLITKRDLRKAQAAAELTQAAEGVGIKPDELERFAAAVARLWPRGKLTPAQAATRWAALGKPAAAALESALDAVARANPDADATDWYGVGRMLGTDRARDAQRRERETALSAVLEAERTRADEAKAIFEALGPEAQKAIVDDARGRLGTLAHLLNDGPRWGGVTRKELMEATAQYVADHGHEPNRGVRATPVGPSDGGTAGMAAGTAGSNNTLSFRVEVPSA